MFLNNAIHQFIKQAGLLPQGKIAAEIVRKGTVSRPLLHAHKKVILVILEERYYVVIWYKNAFALDKVQCSCGQEMPCEHTLAALYFLVESEDKILLETKDVPAGFAIFIQESGRSQKAMPLNEFRKLPIHDLASYIDYLNVYKPPFVRQFSSLNIEKIVLKHNLHIDIELSEKQVFEEMNENPKHVVSLKQEGDAFQILCQTCEEDSFSMCVHQYEVLKNQDIKTMVQTGHVPDYNEESEKWAKKTNISVQKFRILYEIRWAEQKTMPFLVNQHFLSTQKLEKLTQRIEADYLVIPKQKLPADQEGVEEGFGNALLWSIDSRDLGVHLLQGKMDKSGNEFQSKIEKSDYPEFLPGIEKDLWYQIEKFSIENSHDNLHYKANAWNRFLKSLLGEINTLHHYISIGNTDLSMISRRLLKAVRFAEDALEVVVRIEKDDAFYRMKVWLKSGSKILNPKDSHIHILPYFLVAEHEAYVYKHPRIGEICKLLGWDDLLIDTEDFGSLKTLLYSLYNIVDIEFPPEFEPDFIALENPQWKIHIQERGNQLMFIPILNYKEIQEVELPVEKWVFTQNLTASAYVIDENDAEAFMEFMVQQHEQFKNNFLHHGMFFLHYRDYLHENWFLHFYENCRSSGIEIKGQDELENFKMNTFKPSVRMGISSGIDWFDVEVNISYGHQEVSTKAWMDAMKKNEKYILLPDGSLGMIPDEWYDKLKKLSLVAQEDQGKVVIGKYNFNIVESLFDEIEDEELYRNIRAKMSLLSEYDFNKSHELPDQGKIVLRGYQKLGYQWLKSLSELGFGGCLADDMGLGKTLQVLTLLADQKMNGKGCSLIVVPRSLLFSWAKEIEKFYPDLAYMYYHGIDRSKSRPQIFNHDIVISTYDTVTNDIEFLRERVFNYVILDESQAIKNPESKRYKAMRLLKSHNKIAITGTPIENNTFDLYAQFSFVNPGIFGSASQFRTNFALPIDRENDPETAFMLRKIIHPFLLRRTKAQVASDLPERLEQILYCEMGDTQRVLYEEYKNRIKSEIDEGVKKVGINKMRIKVIEGLLRLRQICNSPLLLDATLPNHLRQSVKIETLMDIIENDMGDHHALIYSQFTSMLSLVRAELDKKNIAYAYLDGSTRDRQQAVEYFMENEGVKLFLISLKAGSTGLNLVKADYVYILDPWWNPAVEAQAIDRTHRIGQDKNVFAYKMICRNTIEEKIIQLQDKKKQLATDLIITDEQVFKSLNNEDLISLFT